MRYRVYILESRLLGYQRHQLLLRSPISLLLPQKSCLRLRSQQGGLTLVQYRDKTADDGDSAKPSNYASFAINTGQFSLSTTGRSVSGCRWCLGQQDIPIAVARQMLGPQRLIGRSTAKEMQRAIQGGADYIGVGPVYETPTMGKAA